MNDRRTIAALLRGASDILILTHRRPDGDTAGSAAALCLALRGLGKTAYIWPNPEFSRLAAYALPLCGEVSQPGCVVAVDIASDTQLPDGARHFAGGIDICIDHHHNNTLSAEHKWIDQSAAATGEMIWSLLGEMGAAITPEVATVLYISLSTDTGCFRYTNTSSQTHAITAELMECGADAAGVNKAFFETRSRARIMIERLALQTLEFYTDGKIAVMTVSQDMRRQSGADEDDLADFSGIPRQIEGVLAGIAVYELPGGDCKVSLRTSDGIDAAAICARFGGGGHRAAAGCTLNHDAAAAAKMMVAEVEKALSSC